VGTDRAGKNVVESQNLMFKVLFFGSFQNYSVQVLEKLLAAKNTIKVVGVITTPPRPAGREQLLKQTEVQTFAQKKQLAVLPLENLDRSPGELINLGKLEEVPDFIVVAGYGKLIPEHWLRFPKIAPINVHFSLLPDYPGRFPAEWALLTGETKTGVTIITMSTKFDQGEILTQREITIADLETRETLYKKLYDLGGDLAVETLPIFAEGKIKPISQDLERPHKYARQITRDDGFIPWDILITAVKGDPLQGETLQRVSLFKEIGQIKDITDQSLAILIERMLRAFDPWPGVWTLNQSGRGKATKEESRIKILKGHLEDRRLVIDWLQVEGRSPLSGKDALNFIAKLTQGSD